MESITMDNHENPTNSTEEVDPQDQDVAPGGRSYECIFCKRGLTSAQALGGHMNIHRKDRAKNTRPNYLSTNSNSNKLEDSSSYAYPRFYHPVFTSFPDQTYISTTPNQEEGHTTYFSSTSSIAHAQPINHGNDHQDIHGVIADPWREEKMMSLSLQFGWSGEDNYKESKRRIRSGSKEDELDLELRLGHDP